MGKWINLELEIVWDWEDNDLWTRQIIWKELEDLVAVNWLWVDKILKDENWNWIWIDIGEYKVVDWDELLWMSDDYYTKILRNYIKISKKNNDVIEQLILKWRSKWEIFTMIWHLNSLFGNDLSKRPEWVDNFFRWITIQ